VNNQLTEINLNLNQITKVIITAVVIAISALSIWWLVSTDNDPYIDKVLSYEGNFQRGEAIFQINCAGCHGMHATGNVGPNLLGITKHKSEAQIIQQVISGDTPPMPKFQPSAEDMSDLLSYLRTLS
jgi:mono/diheme cytochrome c family protein